MIDHQLFTHLAAGISTGTNCSGAHSSFLGFPTWYKYLPTNVDPTTGFCTPEVTRLIDIWLVAAAVIKILLRVASLVAVGFVVVGGFSYVVSQGDPNKTAQAKNTIISAIAGLIIAIMSAIIVGFLAGNIS